jgi:hypothetical protein
MESTRSEMHHKHVEHTGSAPRLVMMPVYDGLTLIPKR